ncbi:MAG: DUF4236 domain-containing protein [Clostridia bacterium]|nr:DUF4236 domain-containing protein [Clostridia bacterium]
MRFRKSITIFKGLKVNFSKSGVSVTVGGKGVSANVGPKGVFLNTSIPGTGLYDRKKIADFGGGEKKKTAGATQRLDGAEVAAQAEMIKLEAVNDAFVNIGAAACDMPNWSERELAERPDPEAVEAAIEAWLGQLQLPIDFKVSFEYEDGALLADMDLPEIEQLPAQKAQQTADGTLKQKDKTQKELKGEYARCVFGLGIFCASHCFAVTPHMERILLSAYTQRRDARTGELEDTYIYSVIFEREAFERRGYQNEEPEAFLLRFRNRVNKGADGTLKKIVPYGPEDLEQR